MDFVLNYMVQMEADDLEMHLLGRACERFVWLWLVVYDRKFPVGTVFFSHTNQPAVLLHKPANRTGC